MVKICTHLFIWAAAASTGPRQLTEQHQRQHIGLRSRLHLQYKNKTLKYSLKIQAHDEHAPECAAESGPLIHRQWTVSKPLAYSGMPLHRVRSGQGYDSRSA